MADCRFTSTALGAIRLAQENAARLGHSYVGSEHLLLGLASQEYSTAARLLREEGAGSPRLRVCIAQLVGTGVPGRTLHQGLTPNCCQAIQQAAAEAKKLGQPAVNAEHLLLGLLREEEGIAHRVLSEFGVTDEMVCSVLQRSVGKGVSGAAPSQGLTPRAKSVVELAVS